MSESDDVKKKEVNAKLLAAAPDLLDALEKAWWFIENVSVGDPDASRSYFELREIVREAFEKAEGEKTPPLLCPLCQYSCIDANRWASYTEYIGDKDENLMIDPMILVMKKCLNKDCGFSFWI